MADVYVYSGAAGTGDGSTWTNAFTTLVGALARTGAAAGDRYFIDARHVETSSAAALTVNAKGTLGTPDQFLCVTQTASTPVAADLVDASGGTTGALFQTTGNFNVAFNGFFYARGLHLQAGSGAAGTANVTVGAGGNGSYGALERCLLEIASSGSNLAVTIGNGNAETHLINCSTKFNGSAQGISINNNAFWHNDASVPATLGGTNYFIRNASGHYFEFYGLDLSVFTSDFGAVGGNSWMPIGRFVNCKVNSGTIGVGTGAFGWIDFIACDNGGDIVHNERHDQLGTLLTDEGVYRSAGANINGKNFSWHLGSTTQCAESQYFETFEINVPITTVGTAKTFTFHTLIDSGQTANLDNSKVWVHAEYMGTTGSTTSSIATSHRATCLDTAVTYTTESASGWTTPGIGVPLAQKMTVTLTPQVAGLVRLVIRVGTPSLIMWMDPQPDVS